MTAFVIKIKVQIINFTKEYLRLDALAYIISTLPLKSFYSVSLSYRLKHSKDLENFLNIIEAYYFFSNLFLSVFIFHLFQFIEYPLV